MDGLDRKGILPADDPTLGEMLDEYLREGPRKDHYQAGVIKKTVVGGRTFREWRISQITTDAVKRVSAGADALPSRPRGGKR